MKRKALIILWICLIPIIANAQKQIDGIYYEIVENNCPYKKVRLTNTRLRVCILDEPLISMGGISSVSEPIIERRKRLRTMTIKLSPEASDQLTRITKNLLGKNLVFVLDRKAVSLMKINGTITNGEIKLVEDIEYSNLVTIRKRIEEITGL